MSRPTHVHHINFLFADLDQAVRRFEVLLGAGAFVREALPERDVRAARARLGDTWLVLVSPNDPEADTVPARYLREHGDGFFLLSFGVANLDVATAALAKDAAPGAFGDARLGLDGWRVTDLPDTFGFPITVQLAEDGD